MKDNTQLIMLQLFGSSLLAKERVVLEVNLKEFVQISGDLSNSGWRSLMYLLEEKGMITTSQVGDVRQIAITNLGNDLIIDKFPALNPVVGGWDGSWQTVVFVAPPKGDDRFRFLRSTLLKMSGWAVARGVYLVPSYHSQELVQICSSDYSKNVVVFQQGKVLVGELRDQVIRYFHLEDLTSTYSGLSKEIDQMLDDRLRSGRAKHQQKIEFCSVFNRFWDVLGEDPGFAPRYLLTEFSAQELLSRLQMTFDSYF